MKVAIGIDLGGTNVKGILLSENGEILKQHYIATQDDPEGKWREKLLEMVKYLTNFWQDPIEMIGVSAPGLASNDNKSIAHLPNRLFGLENFIWEEYFGTKTFVLNDAHAALMAEAKYGVIEGYKNAILLTLGTGVGGGIMINGQLYQGLSQMAGHLGHISIDNKDDELSILGTPGSLEYAVGNYSISRRSMGKFQSTHDLVKAYLANDTFATWLWLDSVKKLAITIVSLVNALSPEIVVLAGGITTANEALFRPLNEFIDLYEFRPKGKKTIIKQAKFTDLSGAIGAAAFAFSKC
ncbi:N-acetylglucosamine repressor [Emticicia aquatica]|jgi:glucokinase|uniref:N-acetylglucosamine repressor n=1 Tax=Emticicia aquatica TaxID=1681835 RepID=A0ABN8EWH0_9BACT|nr:ROK family protein [Emticicia aquatica]CAH0996093.1 N-acetylglucosamine repressor [Emticicia aquatica]